MSDMERDPRETRVEEGEPSKLEERVARLEEAERYWWENATLVSAHRRLAKRVQELEERMVPERDLTPAEAMDAMSELINEPTRPATESRNSIADRPDIASGSPEVIAMRNRHGLSFAPDGGCWGTIADKGLDPTDPAVWDEHWAKDGAPHEPVYASPTSPEDTEGLEVVAHQIFDAGHHYYSDGPTYDGRSTPLVRLSDAMALRQRLERVEEGGRP